MQLLTNDADVLMLKLLSKCKKVRWAVAWASEGFDLCNELKKYETKIDQLIVGVHFYQTHPNFIQRFLNHSQVKYMLETNGVFHPKVYLFEHNDDEWDCILGSPNFTRAAFSKNEEVAMHFSQVEDTSGKLYSELNDLLNGFFAQSKKVDEDYLTSYRAIWHRQQRRLEPLSGNYSNPEEPSTSLSPLESELFTKGWRAYYDWVSVDNHHSIEGRLLVLEEARRLFECENHFSDLDISERKGIAGLIREKGLDWKWFGSMQGAFNFKALIRDNDPTISAALDKIPLTGKITHSDFEQYIATIHPALGNNPIAITTRLLALKRPDYFVCLDTKNREKFMSDFGLTKKIHVDEYWDRVVRRIVDSNWWNSAEPTDILESRVWRCRAAFLDVPWYDGL